MATPTRLFSEDDQQAVQQKRQKFQPLEFRAEIALTLGTSAPHLVEYVFVSCL
jgi:hypothetical protein